VQCQVTSGDVEAVAITSTTYYLYVPQKPDIFRELLEHHFGTVPLMVELQLKMLLVQYPTRPLKMSTGILLGYPSAWIVTLFSLLAADQLFVQSLAIVSVSRTITHVRFESRVHLLSLLLSG